MLNVVESITPVILRKFMKSIDVGHLVTQTRLKVTADVWHPSARRLRSLMVTSHTRMKKYLKHTEETATYA